MHLFLTGTAMERITRAFSWMLIHSLWQGLLLFLITLALREMTKKRQAQTRYGIFLFLYSSFIVGCVATFFWEWQIQPIDHIPHGLAGSWALQVSQLIPANLHALKQGIRSCSDYLSQHTHWVVGLWMVVFLYKISRILLAL